MSLKQFSPPEKWILAGIPVLFILGSLMHFLYDFTGQSTLAALFAPVNESVWEHSKLVLWPVILWWVLYDRFRGAQEQLCREPWYAGALFALLGSLLTMPLIYYFYTEAFGTELLWVDILILLLSLLAGQIGGLHMYRRSSGINPSLVLLIFGAVVLIFVLFTFWPPRIPWFQDPLTGGYGIP